MFVGDAVPAGREMRAYAGTTDITGQGDFPGYGCGDMLADSDDLATFMRAVLDGTLLAPASLTAMTAFIPTNGFPPGAYGRGLLEGEVTVAGTSYATWGNGGRGDMMAEVYHLPDLGVTAAILMNHRYSASTIPLPAPALGRIVADLVPRIPPAE